MTVGFKTLATGVTMALIQELGITLVLKEQLSICATMLANSKEQLRKTQAAVDCHYQHWFFLIL